jgi:hypothetical protein
VIVAAMAFCSASVVAAAFAQQAAPGAPQGNAAPTTQGNAKVEVIARSAPVDGQVAVLVRNGTNRPVRVDVVTVAATSAEGGFAMRALAVKAYPQVLAPDTLALAAVRFRQRALPNDTELTAKVRSTPVPAAQAQRALSVGGLVLSPPQTGAVAQTMRATLTNGTRAWTARAPEVAVMCFGEAGNPTSLAAARAAAARVAPGGTAAATVPLASLCPSYLVAARTP